LLEDVTPSADRSAAVGEVRGKGLMLALDLVANKDTREPIDPLSGYANAVAEVARENGVLVRPVGTKIILSPPLVIQREQLDRIVDALAAGFEAVPFA
ncbi:aminotransferase class III-fold pyridoxal phosphate-dependent enzyme, partial [Burkholderia contaminans]